MFDFCNALHFASSIFHRTHSSFPPHHLKASQHSQHTKAGMAEQHNHRIHQLYVRQQFDACSALVDTALAQSGGRCEFALHVKALIERQRGRIGESLKLFQAATTLNPTSASNLKQVARSLLLLGKHRAAHDVYAEALKQAPDDWQLWLHRGQCAAALGDHAAALQCYEAANSITPQDETWLAMGALHKARGDVDAALATYLTALQGSPDSAKLLTTLGITLLRLGDNQRAYDSLATALMHEPREPRALLAAGSITQDHQELDASLVKYKLAAVLSPASPQLWNNIGLVFFGKQRYIAAIACLKRAAYLGPFEWVVAYNLGLAHLATGQAASAFAHLSAAVSLNPGFAHSYALMAAALDALDDRDTAAAACAKAVSIQPSDALLRLNFAVALQVQGDLAAADQQLAEFRRLSGGEAGVDPEALERAAQLEQVLAGP